jgi:mono/diheme cytochrome c family protein
MRKFLLVGLLLTGWTGYSATSAPDEFARIIRPVLAQNCSGCHNSANPKGPVDFLKAQTAADVERQRGVWRNVAAQLRNRTMPPVASKLTEEDRQMVAMWVDQHLQQTACSGQDFAAAVTIRRLNRRDYGNTIRDLLGVDLDVNAVFPEDGSGGEGFDTDGETMFVPPLLMEKYMNAAQQVLDRVVITPPLSKAFSGADLLKSSPLLKDASAEGERAHVGPGDELTAPFSVYADASYAISLTLERSLESAVPVQVRVDGIDRGTNSSPRYTAKGATGQNRNVTLTRGPHTISLIPPKTPLGVISVAITQKAQPASAEKMALHYRLFGMNAGETPLEPRKAAQQLLSRFLRKAYRRPVEQADVDPFMKLYDRAAERGDPYEERIKLALSGVLVSPKFLFRIERANPAPGIHPLRDHEIATRLSYFLWSTMPDEELSRLADEGKLQDPKVLGAQVNRMLDDPRARVFADTFIGQWLGTKDLGGRVVPTLIDLQDFYTPEVAADLREEPVLLFHYMMNENRSLLDLLNADYTFMTDRLVKFYQLQDQVKGVGSEFQLVHWPDNRRGGVFGLGAVLAMTSHYRQSSPVLRGAWVLENILGETVPPPPPDVPALEVAAKGHADLTMRETLEMHRANATCATCHRMIDPIGFGLENFDWMGRWRDTDKGKPVDASGVMPSGDKFDGPVELRQAMLKRKDEFLRNVTQKVLGYALGRSLQDGDQCTVQKIMATLEKDHNGTRTLIREVVMSVPFRDSQTFKDATPMISSAPVRRRVKDDGPE